jgi:mRNA-degrading endonuclease RelE of RelBE toxin-antitoxin system
MSVEIVITDNFKKEAKKLIKKYASLKDELFSLQEQIEANPRLGTLIMENIYKIRLAVKSKGKGKSGGLRVINMVEDEVDEEEVMNTIVNMLSIYDKSEIANLSDKEIKDLINELE